jgi:hypothetical protein
MIVYSENIQEMHYPPGTFLSLPSPAVFVYAFRWWHTGGFPPKASITSLSSSTKENPGSGAFCTACKTILLSGSN